MNWKKVIATKIITSCVRKHVSCQNQSLLFNDFQYNSQIGQTTCLSVADANGTITASSIYGNNEVSYGPQNLNYEVTDWASQSPDNQWLQFSFENIVKINGIRVKFGTFKDYDIKWSYVGHKFYTLYSGQAIDQPCCDWLDIKFRLQEFKLLKLEMKNSWRADRIYMRQIQLCFSPTNGAWSDWSSYGSCEQLPADGLYYKSRTRTCTNPAPSLGGASCEGSTSETEKCEPINGGWSDWEEVKDCEMSVADNLWYKSFIRTCTNPEPQYGGTDCGLEINGKQQCLPVNGQWSNWGDYGDCAKKDDNAWYKSRSRTCTNPEPEYGGTVCPESATEETQCTPVNGGWSDWSSYSECKEADDSTFWYKSRSRTCSNPEAKYGGTICGGDASETTKCPPVNGQWSEWSPYNDCSFSPDGCWYKYRTRECNNPAPSLGGSNCNGEPNENTKCDPIHGQWSEWIVSEGDCSLNADGKWTKRKTRTCEGQQYGGNPCPSDPLTGEADTGSYECPPENGEWSPWTIANDDECVLDGGSWIKPKTRTCDHPLPKYGGICEAEDGIKNVSHVECQPGKHQLVHKI